MKWDWDGVLVLDLVGRDLVEKVGMNGSVVRGPITSVHVDGTLLVFQRAWCAQKTARLKDWEFVRTPLDIAVNMAAVPHVGNTHGELWWVITDSRFIILRPRENLKRTSVKP